MKDERKLADVQQDPAQRFGKAIKDMRAASTPECKPYSKIEFRMPFDAEKWPVSGVDWHSFKSISDVGFS
jgi:hypothetical protein